jgi:hypothetical protein
METPAPQKKKTPRATRVELERGFISGILSMMGMEDLRKVTAGYGNVTWRHFRDRRYQVIWRVMQTLDLTTPYDERLKILEAAGEIPDFDDPKGLKKKISDVEWFIRELRVAGVLSLAGGMVYIRELIEEGSVMLIDFFAKKLKFI